MGGVGDYARVVSRDICVCVCVCVVLLVGQQSKNNDINNGLVLDKR